MAINNDFIVKSGLVVQANTTIPAKDSLVTTNVIRTIAKPTLDLNFVRSNNLDTRITFSRASGASYVNSQGFISYVGLNQPRFDYDPITGQSRGLLIEDQRTNLYSYNTNITTATWISGNLIGTFVTVQENAYPSPDGTFNAPILTNVPNQNSYITPPRFTGYSTATWYTKSVYAKSITGSPYIAFQMIPTDNQYITSVYDIQKGSVVSFAWGSTTGTSTVTSVGNGWYRCALTWLTLSTGNGLIVGDIISIAGYGGYPTASQQSVWGMQVEAGKFATSLIVTGSSSATRVGDYVTMAGQAISSAVNPNAGTIYAEFDTITNGYSSTGGNDFPFLYDFDNQTYQNDGYRALLSAGYGPGVYTDVSANSLTPNRQIATSLGDQSVKKLATAFQLGDASAVLNGGTVYSVTPVTTLPTGIDRLSIGTQSYVGGFGNYFTGHFRRLTYWPQRLSNTQITTLTAS